MELKSNIAFDIRMRVQHLWIWTGQRFKSNPRQANVVTSIIPPKEGLMGVAQNSKDVDDGGRTVEGVRTILSEMGMELATVQEYRSYIENNFHARRICS